MSLEFLPRFGAHGVRLCVPAHAQLSVALSSAFILFGALLAHFFFVGLFSSRVGFACGGEQALDVVSKMLAYDPLKRIKPLEVCSHEFVDEVCEVLLALHFFLFSRFWRSHLSAQGLSLHELPAMSFRHGALRRLFLHSSRFVSLVQHDETDHLRWYGAGRTSSCRLPPPFTFPQHTLWYVLTVQVTLLWPGLQQGLV